MPAFQNKARSVFIEKKRKIMNNHFSFISLDCTSYTVVTKYRSFKNSAEAGKYGDFVKMVDENRSEVLNSLVN